MLIHILRGIVAALIGIALLCPVPVRVTALDDPRAKIYTPQQLTDLSFPP